MLPRRDRAASSLLVLLNRRTAMDAGINLPFPSSSALLLARTLKREALAEI